MMKKRDIDFHISGYLPSYHEYYLHEDLDLVKEKRTRFARFSFVITSAVIVFICMILCSWAFFNVMQLDLIDVLGDIVSNGNHDGQIDLDRPVVGTLSPSESTVNSAYGDRNDDGGTDKNVVDLNNIYNFNLSAVPLGETPIIPMDLSLYSYGDSYINNTTGLTPNTDALLNMKLRDIPEIEFLSYTSAPTVLIIHTHGTESYMENGAISYDFEKNEEFAHSTTPDKSVVEVGRVLSHALFELGINNIHCEKMHDKDEYRYSYERAEETVEYYLEKYPTIKLVIDLHRDSIIKSSGEIVRPVTVVDGKPTAQMMCVVGSDWGGEENDKWERNLALALQIRKAINDEYGNVCRPPYLKSSTYNQEIAPCSILLEVGSSGNSMEEACNAVLLFADRLAEIL